MIRMLSGIVRDVFAESICLDVSGFGLELFASGTLLAGAVVDEPLVCRAFLQVSDAGMTLFGFSDDVERELFLEITQVKTMGGKLSIALLRHLEAGEIVRAILNGDTGRLSVPGLGAKRAERICFELRNRVEKKFAELASSASRSGRSSAADQEVLGGLLGLGFSRSESLRAIAESRAETGGVSEEEELLRLALARLRKTK